MKIQLIKHLHVSYKTFFNILILVFLSQSHIFEARDIKSLNIGCFAAQQ